MPFAAAAARARRARERRAAPLLAGERVHVIEGKTGAGKGGGGGGGAVLRRVAAALGAKVSRMVAAKAEACPQMQGKRRHKRRRRRRAAARGCRSGGLGRCHGHNITLTRSALQKKPPTACSAGGKAPSLAGRTAFPARTTSGRASQLQSTCRCSCPAGYRHLCVPRPQVVGARGCTLAVVAGAAAKKPAGLPDGALCVREEWLLSAAAEYRRPQDGFVALEA